MFKKLLNLLIDNKYIKNSNDSKDFLKELEVFDDKIVEHHIRIEEYTKTVKPLDVLLYFESILRDDSNKCGGKVSKEVPNAWVNKIKALAQEEYEDLSDEWDLKEDKYQTWYLFDTEPSTRDGFTILTCRCAFNSDIVELKSKGLWPYRGNLY